MSIVAEDMTAYEEDEDLAHVTSDAIFDLADEDDDDEEASADDAATAIAEEEAAPEDDATDNATDNDAIGDETLADLIAAVSQNEAQAEGGFDEGVATPEEAIDEAHAVDETLEFTADFEPPAEDPVAEPAFEEAETPVIADVDLYEEENAPAPEAFTEATPEAMDDVADDPRPEPEAREKSAQLEPLSETNGNVGRLLKETDAQFADDEGIRRRRVISQMRAAVAATKAERVLSTPISPAEQARQDQSPYRRDLDRVKPADPTLNVGEAAEAPAPAPAAPAPVAEDAPAPATEASAKAAPLVLVSSQRVDEAPASTPAPAPSRPDNRVVSEGARFAAFAEEMGAEELPDLLEAAAAFSAFVEGQPHFSRPEIMKRVARIDPALSLSREIGLRSFGMLLRQGKIRKLQRGQFTIAEDTRFNPAHRIAGQ